MGKESMLQAVISCHKIRLLVSILLKPKPSPALMPTFDTHHNSKFIMPHSLCQKFSKHLLPSRVMSWDSQASSFVLFYCSHAKYSIIWHFTYDSLQITVHKDSHESMEKCRLSNAQRLLEKLTSFFTCFIYWLS